jgi:5'-AMP-activated protein kinase regulatory gamma subunit
MSNPVYQHLHNISVKEIAQTGLVSIKSSDSVENAIRILADHKILSVPVMENNSVIGVLDIVDVVHFLRKIAPDQQSIEENQLLSLEIAGRALALEAVKEIINASGRDPYVPIDEHNKLSMAVNLFAQGIHRVPVSNSTGAIVGTLSQTDIISYLRTHIVEGELKHVGNKTMQELGLHNKPVVTVNIHDSILAAIEVIVDKSTSGVGVINSHGKLVGNLSASDFKGLYREQFPSFLLNIGDYLEKHSPNSLNPICCTANTTLTQVINEMTENHIHHLYVIDDFKPASIISATDVMKSIRDFVL